MIDGSFHIKFTMVRSCRAQISGEFDSEAADFFFGVFHCHLVQTVFIGGGGTAKCDGATCLDLQMQSRGFYCMGHAQRGFAVGGTELP